VRPPRAPHSDVPAIGKGFPRVSTDIPEKNKTVHELNDLIGRPVVSFGADQLRQLDNVGSVAQRAVNGDLGRLLLDKAVRHQ
jgi:hypothetical protein